MGVGKGENIGVVCIQLPLGERICLRIMAMGTLEKKAIANLTIDRVKPAP